MAQAAQPAAALRLAAFVAESAATADLTLLSLWRAWLDRTITAARGGLAPGEATVAWAEGVQLSLDAAIAQARAGIFDDAGVNDIPESLRTRYFQRKIGTDVWEVKPALREMVTIERHNLMDPLRRPGFDCIFIRNVLIYFNRESKQVVIDNLVRALVKGGYLVVGPSEGIFDMLGMLKKCSTFLYRKE